MAGLFEMKQDHTAALNRADAVIAAAEAGNRPLTQAETETVDAAMSEAQSLAPQIATVEKRNTLRGMFPNGIVPAASGRGGSSTSTPNGKKVLSRDYMNDFHKWVASGGQEMGAALYEGNNPAGGFAVPVLTDGEIVPLAPLETGVRKLAQVIPTTNDLKVPIKASFGVSAAKAESGATQNTFAESGPTLGEFTLGAYMAGAFDRISFELAQDVPAFQSFVISDLLSGQQTFEEGWYIGGTGSGQPQGLLGNVGAGVTEEPDANGNLVSIDGTLDLIGTLKAPYHANAAFLMARTTSIVIRKAQRQANLFEPVWTRSNNQDYLHGYPVEYSASMPTAARSACPMLFGDFKQGFLIGDRGGSGINIKILDQPFALQGQIALVAYRRTDSRVRRSEAIQSYNVAAS